MKTTVATALSLMGVIAAGSAAAMVNTTIFDTAPNEAAASAVIVPETRTIDLTIPTPVPAAPAASSSEAASSASVAQSESVRISSSSQDVGALVTETSVEPIPTIAPAPSTTVPSPTTPAPAPTTTAPAIPTTTAPLSEIVTYNVGEAGSVTLDVIDGRLTIIDATPGNGWTATKAEHYRLDNAIEVVFLSNTLEVKFDAMRVNGVTETAVDARAINDTPYYDDDDDEHEEDEHDDDDDEDEHDDDDDHDDD